MDQSILDNFAQSHPGCRLLSATHDGVTYEVIVKRPRRVEYKSFRADLFREETKPLATERLLYSCLLYPEAAKFDAMLEDFPGASEVFGARVAEMCGSSVEASSKKAGS